jgi:hypothetical protein
MDIFKRGLNLHQAILTRASWRLMPRTRTDMMAMPKMGMCMPPASASSLKTAQARYRAGPEQNGLLLTMPRRTSLLWPESNNDLLPRAGTQVRAQPERKQCKLHRGLSGGGSARLR